MPCGVCRASDCGRRWLAQQGAAEGAGPEPDDDDDDDDEGEPSTPRPDTEPPGTPER